MPESSVLKKNNRIEIDVIALLRGIWSGRKTVIIWTCVFIILGLAAALTMKRKYVVSTVMVPQLNSTVSTSSLSSLASLAGFDLSSATAGSELSPLIYPQIVNSIPFRKELIYTPLHYSKCDTAVSMYTYATEIAKETVLDFVIGIPGELMKLIRGKKKPIVLPTDGYTDNSAKPLFITEEEETILKDLSKKMSLAVDKKEGYVTLTVEGIEPIQTAELAIKAQQLLQDEVTRFRIEKSQSELDYIQARYNEVKKETESYQEQLAKVSDRLTNTTSRSYLIEQQRLQTKFNNSNSIYNELAKQLEQAKMQVKKDTPIFTVIQPVTVPIRSANSRSKTLIAWTFLGFILGCGVVVGKNLMKELKSEK